MYCNSILAEEPAALGKEWGIINRNFTEGLKQIIPTLQPNLMHSDYQMEETIWTGPNFLNQNKIIYYITLKIAKKAGQKNTSDYDIYSADWATSAAPIGVRTVYYSKEKVCKLRY